MMLHRDGPRRGVILTIVLICALLLIAMAVAFQFISSSDYREAGRLMRSVQAAALADLASDEIYATLATVNYGPSDPKPQWVSDLLTALNPLRGTANPIDLQQSITFPAAALPITNGAAIMAKGIVNVASITGIAGPFLVLPTGGMEKLIYKEPLFNDAAKDLTAWDLRAPLGLQVSVAGSGGPFEFSQKYYRGQLLEITDTTPPAAEFGLFSYCPPPTEEYALDDLQRGGSLIINPGASPTAAGGRIQLRGPLMLVPEDPPPPPTATGLPWMGDVNGPPLPVTDGNGTHPSANFPDGQWADAFATVPGPREALHPEAHGNGLPDPVMKGVSLSSADVLTSMTPRRPAHGHSICQLKTKPFMLTIHIVGVTVHVPIPYLDIKLDNISAVLVDKIHTQDASYDSTDEDPVAYYPPQSYFYGPLPPGGQKFQILSTMPSTNPYCYKGITVPMSGANPAVFNGEAGQEGDVSVTEPVPRAGKPGPQNEGLIGVYGVSLVDGKTYKAVPIYQFSLWMTQRGINTLSEPDRSIAQGDIDSIALQVLEPDNLNLPLSLTFLVRRFQVEGGVAYDTPPSNLHVSLPTALQAKQAALAPFGTYYHQADFWNSGPGQVHESDMLAALKTDTLSMSLNDVLNHLCHDDGPPDMAAVDPSWPVGTPLLAPSEAKVVRDWMVGDYAKQLLRFTSAQNATAPDLALTALLQDVKYRPNLPPPLPPAMNRRPQGAFGPYVSLALVTPDLNQLGSDFPDGIFPPKFRNFELSGSRTYATMDDYVAAEQVNGLLELRGAVVIRNMTYHQNITYHGRGLIIAMTTDPNAPATLDGNVVPAPGDNTSVLTLVHRVSADLMKTGKPPALRIGAQFTGSCFSDSGVKGISGGTTVISGNLVTALLNKEASGPADTTIVKWNPNLLNAAPAAGMVPNWTVEMGGEVTSLEPGL